MKRLSTGLFVTLLALSSVAQTENANNTLLWKIRSEERRVGKECA